MGRNQLYNVRMKRYTSSQVRERLADTEMVDPPKYLAPARDAIADTVIAITAVVSAPAGSSSPIRE